MTVGVTTAPDAAQIAFDWPSGMTVMTADGITNAEIANEVMPVRRHPFQRQVVAVGNLSVVAGRNDVIAVEGTGRAKRVPDAPAKESWSEKLAKCKARQASNLRCQGRIAE